MTLPFATRKDVLPVDKAYQRLNKWISESLDNIKVELHAVLYPLFVFSYLKCIVNQNTDMAKKLLELAKSDHNVDEFLSINDQQHLQESGLYTKWMDSKVTVQLSRFAFELLINFLDEHSMIIFLTILNSNLEMKIIDKNNIKSTMQASHHDKVFLGSAPVHEDIPLILKAKLKEEDLLPMYDQLQKQAELQTDRPMPSRVPIATPTYLDIQKEIEDLKDLKRRIKVNNRYLPSICCYTLHNTNNQTSSVKLNHDITILGAGFKKSTIKLWSLNDHKLRSLVNDPDPNAMSLEDVLDQGSLERELVGHSGPVYDMEFSRDKRFLLSCSQDASIRLWSLQNYSNMCMYQGHQYPVWDIDMGDQMTYFVSGSMDGTCRLWTTDRVQPLRMFVGHLSDVDCVKLHDNLNYVLTGSSDRTCRLWDVVSGDSVRLFTGHDAPISQVAYSPDGRLFACSSHHTIYLWDIAECKLLAKCQGHTDIITSLAFDQMGNLLTSGALDGSVAIWDIQSSSELMSPLKLLYTKATPILDLMFTKRNLLMAVGSFCPDLLKYEK